jgi:hypothetical protein
MFYEFWQVNCERAREDPSMKSLVHYLLFHEKETDKLFEKIGNSANFRLQWKNLLKI